VNSTDFPTWALGTLGAGAVLAATALPVLRAKSGVLRQRWLTWLALIGIYAVAVYLGQWATVTVMALVVVICAVEYLKLARGLTVLGLIWIVVGAAEAALAPLDGYELFLVIAAFDIGGWVGGQLAKKTGFAAGKIAPNVSPNKTYAGLLISLVAGASVLAILQPNWLAAYPVIALLAVAGDLVESWLKRRAGVKDAGSWLPGFGGLLDRVDAFLAVCMIMWLLP
jgi:phosphatidate cytidylyltransferase